MKFNKKIPIVGQIVEISIGNFVMDVPVRCRYASTNKDQQLILDVPDTPQSSLPLELTYHTRRMIWTVTEPRKCPFFGDTISVIVKK